MKILSLAVLSAAAFLTACGGAGDNSNTAASPGAANSKSANASASPVPVVPNANGETLKLAPGNSTLTFVVPRKNDRRQAGFTMFEGTFDLVNGKPEESSFRIEADANSIFSDDPALTEQLRSAAFLDAAQFPKATFRSTKIEAGARPPDNYTVTGDLTIRGQTKPVNFPALITVTDSDLTMKVGFRTYRKEFGLTNEGGADNPVRDDFSIMLDVKVPRGRH